MLSPVGNRVTIFDLANHVSHTLPFQTNTDVDRLCLSPDGQLLLACDVEGRGLLVNILKEVVLTHISFGGPVRDAVFSPCGKYLATAVGRLLKLWLTPTLPVEFSPLQLYRTHAGPSNDITCLSFSPDSHYVAFGSVDMSIRVVSISSQLQRQASLLAGHRHALVGVSFVPLSPSDDVNAHALPYALHSLAHDSVLCTWTVEAALPDDSEDDEEREKEKEKEAPSKWRLSHKHYLNSPTHLGRAVGMYVAPATHLAVVAVDTGAIALYDLWTQQQLQSLTISTAAISAVVLSPDATWIGIAAAETGSLAVWEWQSETYILRQQGHSLSMRCVAADPSDPSRIATGGEDEQVKVWDVTTGLCIVSFTGHTAPVTGVALSTSRAVLSASLDGTVRCCDLVRYRHFRTLTTPSGAGLSCLAVSGDAELVSAGCATDFSSYIWSLTTGRLLMALPGHQAPIAALCFSPSAPGTCATASWDGSVRLSSCYDSSRVDVLTPSVTSEILSLAFSPDGNLLATGAASGGVTLWDVPLSAVLGTIPIRSASVRRESAKAQRSKDEAGGRGRGKGKDEGAVTAVAFAPAGTWLLCAIGHSPEVALVSVASQTVVHTFRVLQHAAYALGMGGLNRSGDPAAQGPGSLEIAPTHALQRRQQLQVSKDKDGRRQGLPTAAIRGLAFSSDGAVLAVATDLGLCLYDNSLYSGRRFDPQGLTEAATPQNAKRALQAGNSSLALSLGLALGDAPLTESLLAAIPASQAMSIVQQLPESVIESCWMAVAATSATDRQLCWTRALIERGPKAGHRVPASLRPVLSRVHRSLHQKRRMLEPVTRQNRYRLRALVQAGRKP